MSSKKIKMIQTRPEPPNLDSIRSDLEEAPYDDVAFTFFKSMSQSDEIVSSSEKTKSDSRSPRSEQDLESSRDFLKTSLMTEMSSTVASTSAKTKSRDLDHCYNQTLKFIQMNEYLGDSQDRLADQSAELQQLGQAIKEQVESLRTQLS